MIDGRALSVDTGSWFVLSYLHDFWNSNRGKKSCELFPFLIVKDANDTSPVNFPYCQTPPINNLPALSPNLSHIMLAFSKHPETQPQA